MNKLGVRVEYPLEIIDLRDKAKNLKLDITVVYIALKRNEYSDIVRIKRGSYDESNSNYKLGATITNYCYYSFDIIYIN